MIISSILYQIFKTIFYGTTTIISIFVLYNLIIGIICYIKILYYKNQNIPTFFTPVLGYGSLYFDSKAKKYSEKEKLTKRRKGKPLDQLAYFKHIVNTLPDDAPGFAINHILGLDPVIVITHPEFINDFVLKEFDISIKKSVVFDLVNFTVGLFFMNGHEAMEKRAIFSELFGHEKLSSFIQGGNGINQMMKKELRMVNIEKDEWKDFDVRTILRPIMKKMINIFFFGNPISPQIEGIDILEYIDILTYKIFALIKDPVGFITGGLNIKLGLDPRYKEIDLYKMKLKKKCYELYLEADKLNDSELNDCALHNIVRFNRKCEKEGRNNEKLDENEIFGNILLVQFAGTDTSFNASSSILTFFAFNKEMQNFFRKLIIENKLNQDPKFDDFFNNEDINNFMKEAFRIFGPATRIVTRKIIKNCELKNKAKTKTLKLKKGAWITIPMVMLNMKKNTFKDPEIFDKDRFKTKKYRNTFFPFYQGKRKCLGENLGEVMVRMILTNFLDVFEIREREELRNQGERPFGGYRWTDQVLYSVEEAVVGLKKRKEGE